MLESRALTSHSFTGQREVSASSTCVVIWPADEEFHDEVGLPCDLLLAPASVRRARHWRPWQLCRRIHSGDCQSSSGLRFHSAALSALCLCRSRSRREESSFSSEELCALCATGRVGVDWRPHRAIEAPFGMIVCWHYACSPEPPCC